MKSEIMLVSSIAYGGAGVARGEDGKVCFIPRTLPGEKVEVRIITRKKRFNTAELLQVVEASEYRQIPECSLFEKKGCPGCAYIHCSYEYELNCKHQQFRDFLVRPGLIGEEALLPPFASEKRFGCRNKLVLHSNGSNRGYIADDNCTLLPLKNCLLACSQINELLTVPPQSPRETFRFTANDGALNVSLCSKEYLTETLPGYGDFMVAPEGFFQTNTFVAAELVRRCVDTIAAGKFSNLIELYCGVGVFSIAAAENIPGLFSCGIEYDKKAVAFARRNAERHQVNSRCTFYAGDAGKMLKKQKVCRNSIMLIDPPRSGMNQETIRTILNAAPEKLIYISCAPDTLARDLKLLNHAYRIENAGVLDMFPGTAHFESMTVLTRI